jgi:hypothetical protein
MDGMVESCSLDRPLGYFVKVKLARPSWSEQEFTPKHMLRIDEPAPKLNHLGAASGY